MAAGAVTAASRMSSRATPPAAWQLVEICANNVVPVRSRVSAKQILFRVAAGKSVGEAPPLVSKTKFAVIAVLISEPPLEVVAHVAGMHCGFATQPEVLVGCAPPRTSTVFCAKTGAAASVNKPARKIKAINLLIASSSGLMSSGWRISRRVRLGEAGTQGATLREERC